MSFLGYVPFLALEIYKITEPVGRCQQSVLSVNNNSFFFKKLADQIRASIGIFDMDFRRVEYIHTLRIHQDMGTDTVVWVLV